MGQVKPDGRHWKAPISPRNLFLLYYLLLRFQSLPHHPKIQIHKLGETLPPRPPLLVKLHPFLHQQPPLLDRVLAPVVPRPLVPAQRAVRRQDPVARHRRRERVRPHRVADGPRPGAQVGGEAGVGRPPARRHGEQDAIDAAAEGRQCGMGGDPREGFPDEGAIEGGMQCWHWHSLWD